MVPLRRVGGRLQCLIGNRVSEDVFLGLVAGASGGVGIVHGFLSAGFLPGAVYVYCHKYPSMSAAASL
jgi:hypothetical protein